MATQRLDTVQFKALDLKLGALVGAVNRLSDNIGKWLATLAQALANPEDAELRAQIVRLKASEDALQEAVEAQPPTQ